MPYVLQGQEIPPQVTKNDSKVYKILLYLNILMSLIDGATYFGYWQERDNGKHYKTFNCLNFFAQTMVYLLQIISAFYYGCSITRIQSYFIDNGMKHYMNIEILLVHASVFIMYVISILALAVFQGIYYFLPSRTSTKTFL